MIEDHINYTTDIFPHLIQSWLFVDWIDAGLSLPHGVARRVESAEGPSLISGYAFVQEQYSSSSIFISILRKLSNMTFPVGCEMVKMQVELQQPALTDR